MAWVWPAGWPGKLLAIWQVGVAGRVQCAVLNLASDNVYAKMTMLATRLMLGNTGCGQRFNI